MISGDEVLIRKQSRDHSRSRTTTRSNASSLTVWLVDNDREFSSLLTCLLNKQDGITCSRYFSCAEAVLAALARETPPHVILLDINMGGISGLEAVRPIKSLARSTHVFMLTSFYDSQYRARALRDGATDFLLKADTVEKISGSILRTDGATDHSESDSLPEAAQRPENAANSGTVSSSWPKRRAPEFNTGRFDSDKVTTQRHPDRGRRSVPWRSVPSQLVRGVGHLREFLGLSSVKPLAK